MVARITLRINQIQPTQLYINARKLAALEARFPPGLEMMMDPVPVIMLHGVASFTDGHTRAVLAWRRGLVDIEACWDDSELDLGMYDRCFEWCQSEGIRTIADLAGRIISDAEYNEKWIARCEAWALNNRTEKQRKK